MSPPFTILSNEYLIKEKLITPPKLTARNQVTGPEPGVISHHAWSRKLYRPDEHIQHI